MTFPLDFDIINYWKSQGGGGFIYLQLDNNILIPKGKVLGIFDLDNASWEKITRDFLKSAQDEGRVVVACDDLPRSFVLACEDFGNTTVYLSGRSSRRLKKRFEQKNYTGQL